MVLLMMAQERDAKVKEFQGATIPRVMGGDAAISAEVQRPPPPRRVRAWHVSSSAAAVDTRTLALPPPPSRHVFALPPPWVAHGKATDDSQQQQQQRPHSPASSSAYSPQTSPEHGGPWSSPHSPSSISPGRRRRGRRRPRSPPAGRPTTDGGGAQRWWLAPPDAAASYRESKPIIQDRKRVNGASRRQDLTPTDTALLRTISPPPLSLRPHCEHGVGPPLSPPTRRSGAAPVNHFAIEPLKHLRIGPVPTEAYAPLPPHPGWHLELRPGSPTGYYSPGSPARAHYNRARSIQRSASWAHRSGGNATTTPPAPRSKGGKNDGGNRSPSPPASSPRGASSPPLAPPPLSPPVHPTVHARVLAARDQEARRRRFRALSYSSPPIYLTKPAREQGGAATSGATIGPGALVSVSPSPPNYGYVGYVGTEGYEQRVLSQHIGRVAASKGVGSGVEISAWAADALRRAQREHEAAEDDLRIVQSLEEDAWVEDGSSELRLMSLRSGCPEDVLRSLHPEVRGRTRSGSSDGGYPHQLLPYTIKQSESIAGTNELADEDGDDDFWWRAEPESFDLCVFFARLCRWPCAECVGGGRQPDIDGNPTWLGSLRRAHRRVHTQKPVDFRGVI